MMWRVIDMNGDVHTDGLTEEEAVTLAQELSVTFEDIYIYEPDHDYEERMQRQEELDARNFRTSVDGWEDIYPDRDY